MADLSRFLTITYVQYNTEDKFLFLVDYLQDLYFDEVGKKEKFFYGKVDNRLTGQEFIKSVKDQIISLQKSANEKEIEKPVINFRGYPLVYTEEEGDRVYFTDLFWSRSTCVIVRSPENQPFELVPIQLGLQPEPELCEYCDERHVLKIACSCNQAFYCSIRCRVKNLGFHRKLCPYAFQIEPLLEMQEEFKESPSLQFELGLINLGNTCYMSSVCQVLRLYPPLITQLKSLDKESMLALNRRELNIWPYLYDAFFRMNFGAHPTHAPYLLKAAVGIKNPSVGSADYSSSASIKMMLWSSFNAF